MNENVFLFMLPCVLVYTGKDRVSIDFSRIKIKKDVFNKIL